MTKPVRFDAEAEAELEAAAAWYESHRPGFGAKLLDAVAAATAQLADGARRHPLVPGVRPALGIRRVRLRRFPLAVVFIELENEIRVIAVAHTRRRPLYLKRRLGALR